MAIVLVTGSSGFIGRPLVAALQTQGHLVHGLDPVIVSGAELIQHRDNLDSLERLESLLSRHKIERVVHAGGVSGPMVAQGKPHFICSENISASVNLFEASRRTGVRRVVSISSAAALGPTDGEIVPDDAPLRPGDIYGASKASVELLLSAYANEFGVSGASLRMPTMYGPGMPESGFIAKMIAASLAGRAFTMTWGRGYACPYLFIDDAVAAICGALAAPALPQPMYNVAGAEFVATETIARLIAERIPQARITLGEGPPMKGYRRGLMDIKAARRDFGFHPHVDIATGISQCIESALQQARKEAMGCPYQ